MRGENSNIAMEDDPAEQGHRGGRDLPPNVERERAHQSGGERGKLPEDDREDREEGRRSER